jgi:hypothetical protein
VVSPLSLLSPHFFLNMTCTIPLPPESCQTSLISQRSMLRLPVPSSHCSFIFLPMTSSDSKPFPVKTGDAFISCTVTPTTLNLYPSRATSPELQICYMCWFCLSSSRPSNERGVIRIRSQCWHAVTLPVST